MPFQNNYYKFSIFPRQVIHGISTKHFGSIKDNNGFYEENLKNFKKTLGIESNFIVFPKQKHTKNVRIVSDQFENLEETDGLITNNKDLFLGIVTADCLPIIFFDKSKEIISVIHAGYKGILNGIFEETFLKLKSLGSDPGNILVGVGPGIGPCCYNVLLERIDQFKGLSPQIDNFYIQKNNEYFLDLFAISSQILHNNGIRETNLEIERICTKCNMDKFFSYRGNNRKSFGNFATVAEII